MGDLEQYEMDCLRREAYMQMVEDEERWLESIDPDVVAFRRRHRKPLLDSTFHNMLFDSSESTERYRTFCEIEAETGRQVTAVGILTAKDHD